MTALATSPLFWIGLLEGLAALYVLPTIIAVVRRVESIALVVFVNCFPVAWAAALVIACMMPRKQDWYRPRRASQGAETGPRPHDQWPGSVLLASSLYDDPAAALLKRFGLARLVRIAQAAEQASGPPSPASA